MAEQTAPPADPPADAAEAEKDKNRMYGVFVTKTLDLTQTAADIVAEIKKDLTAEQSQVVVMVKIGKAMAPTTRKALEMLATHRDLDGSYQTVADSAVSNFDNVKTETRRDVSIG